ncbi:hypothetical protein [Halocatena halophila]|uniref:hypothetical protein n=1 Tax=Halocatena halophila TaxID=2814576 RepID=UPI002ED4F8AB
MNNTQCRADYVEVTDIKSDSYAKPPGGDSGDVFLVTRDDVDEKCVGDPQRYEIAWEVTKGIYGPKTLIKEVQCSTAVCPECDSIGRYDERGDVCCVNDNCGVVISGGAEPISYDVYNGMSVATEPEPDVQ